jgi:hypothetical protein
VQQLVNFGHQPPSNRFEATETPESDTHPLRIGECRACGLVQLIDPMPVCMSAPRFPWLTYNEPEDHLDGLVDRLCGLPGLNAGSRIVGTSYKDDSTLARFAQRGFAGTRRYGSAADLLLARHALEHAHDPVGYLHALAALVKPGGYLVLEVPEATKFMRACDYSFVWEEHITYFSHETLRALLARIGFGVEEFMVHPYPVEDSLIAIVRNGQGAAVAPAPPDESAGSSFSRGYHAIRARLQSLLGAWRREGLRVAIFGAGHLAVRFVNLYKLGGFIELVIDDNPDKQGLLMPGSRLPIKGSDALEATDVCLSSLSAETERKALPKFRPFLDRGGRLYSIFAINPNTVYAAA